MPTFTFKKAEKLKSRSTIQQMFSKGNSFANYPLRLVWIEQEKEGAYPVQFTLSVAKKKFPKAAHRNRLRRRIREAWRLNKHLLYEKIDEQNKQYAFMIIYGAKEEFSYDEIEAAMKKIIFRFIKKTRANQNKSG